MTHAPEPLLRFIEAGRSFSSGSRTVHALQAASADFFPGQFVGIVGKSGSGKSTFLNLACGLDQPTEGRVEFLGKSLGQLHDEDLTGLRLHRVGFVFQFFNLLPTLTALENVMLPARLAGQSAKAARSRAEELLTTMGLAPRLHHWPDQLSGGEQQRTALARALVNDPQLILADEPTGNLDTESGQLVLNQLSRLAHQENRLVVMVTHSREALEGVDRVIDLKDGRVVADQSTSALSL